MRIRTACATLLVLLVPAIASAQSSEVRTAIRHMQAVASATGQPTADFVATDAVASPNSPTTFVYLRQSIGGIEVVGTEATVVVRNGAVVHMAGGSRLADVSASKAATPALTAPAAASVLARHNGLGGSFAVLSQKAGADRAVTMTSALAPETVPARLVYLGTEAGEVALAWEVALPQVGDHMWLGYVDAESGRVLRQQDLVVHDTFGESHAATSFAPLRTQEPLAMGSAMVGSYTVFALPLESPYDGGRTAVANPDDATASPYGWHDTNGSAGAEYTTTQGNNVHAYTDTDNNNSPDTGSSPSGGSGLTFNFAADLGQAPSTYRPASVTNLFYWNNIIHDILYHHGFDEASGNFQVNNYGRGGSGNDYVQAESQDGGGTNNANFATPSDGSRPRMQMYIGTNPNPDVDGSFDNGVVVHEYGHGISNRLTGGRTQAGCLGNAEQMGEGWSDYYAMMLSMVASDQGSDARGMGNYLFGYGPNGGGIRLAPYSTNFSVNNYTYGRTRTMSAVHQIGFVWATILWEVTWDMIDAHGFSSDFYNGNGTAGNQIMLRLVTEGMKYQPCSPGFVTGRDGILAAEQALYGGAYASTLQAAFARRGLGYSASQGSSNSNGDNTEAFDLWPTGGNNPPTAAFTYSCTGLSCSFTDASSDSDGSIASRAWTFGDGGSSSATNPSRTYASAGTYTVTLTVTDNDGATDSASQSVTVTSGGGGNTISLSVSTRTRGNRAYADLSWSPADGGNVYVYVDGSNIGSTRDDGSVSVNMGRNVSGTFTFQVCETQSGGDCSNVASASFFAGFAESATTAPEAVEADALSVPGAAMGSADVAPNPFATTTSIRFEMAAPGEVTLDVFDALGQRVARLAEGIQDAGTHRVTFDATALPAGVYVYRLTTGSDVQTGRMVVAR